MIRTLPLPAGAEVTVLGDTAYDAEVVRQACAERGYIWIMPANPERVYQGVRGQRPKLRSRLKDWTSLSLQTIRLRASTGQYADYRRLSKWRVGPKTETARVLRLSGKIRSAQRRPRATGFFDNETKSVGSDARRRENPDDERAAPERQRRDRAVLAALADRAVLQGTEVDAGLRPVSLPVVRGSAGLGRTRHHDRAVPGAPARATLARSAVERGTPRSGGQLNGCTACVPRSARSAQAES